MPDDKAQVSDPQTLLVRPIVVPRGYGLLPDSPNQGYHLFFYLVFSLYRDPKGDPQKPFVPPGSMEKDWPGVIYRLLTGKGCRFSLRDLESAQNGFDTDEIKVLTPPDLRADQWVFDPARKGEPGLAKSNELWNRLVGPSSASSKGGGGRARVRSHLARVYAPTGAQSTTSPGLVKALEAAAVDPSSASDLRPGFRLEALDPHTMSAAFQSARLKSAGTVVSEALDPAAVVLLDELRSANLLGAFRTYLNGKDEAGQALSQRADDILRMYFRDDPRFKESIRRTLETDPALRASFDSIVSAYHDFALHGGQTQLRRHARFISGSRHREPYAKTASSPAGGGPGGLAVAARAAQPMNSGAGAADAPVTIAHPNFEDILAQVRQHPGLARRLFLSVSCAVSCPVEDTAKKTHALKTIAHGMTWVQFSWKPTEHGNLLSPFHEPPLPTACQLVPGNSKDESCFRAEPREGKTFLSADDKVPDPKEIWRRYHVLPSRYYTVTQEDYSLAAARAELGVDAPASARGPADSDASDHLVNSINIYSTPWNAQGGRITTAEALHRHLNHANDHAQRSATHAVQWIGGVNQEPHKETRLYAESLMQGVTVFVRHLTDTRSMSTAFWRSLCRRLIELEIPDPDADNPAYRIVFEEEGFLATSAVVAPRPQTGLVSAIVAGGPGQPPKSFAVDVLRVQNTVGPKPQQFQPSTDTTQLGSLISPYTEWSDVREYDVVLVTPEGGEPPPRNGQGQPIDPRDNPLNAHELVVHPVFRALGDPIRKLDLSTFQGLRVLKAANRLPEKGQVKGTVETVPSRKDRLYPVLIAAHATRFLDERGAAIEPKGLSQSAKQPHWRAGLADDDQGKLKDFYHFVVEGERRYYALPPFQCGTAATTPFLATTPSGSPPLPSALGSAPRTEGVLCGFGPANALSPVHLNPLTDVWGALTVPRPAAGPAIDPNFTTQSTDPHAGEVTDNPLTCGELMVLGQLDASSPLSLFRGRVTAMRFALQVKLKQNPGTTTIDPTTSMMLGDKKRWDIQDGVLPPIPKPDLKSKYTYEAIQKIAAVPPDGVLGVILQVQGTAEFATDGGDHLKLTADSYALIKQAASVDGLETAPPALAWVLVIETLDGRTLNATFPDRGDGIPDTDKVTRFLHPVWAIERYVEAIGVPGPGSIDCRSWPQNVLGTFQAGVNRIAFTDGTQITKAVLKATLVDRATGFFAVSWDATTKTPKIEAAARAEGILIAGEVNQSMRAKKTILDLGIEAGDPMVELVDLYGQTWTIHQPVAAEAAIQPASPDLPPRPLEDLESGEFLVARCEVDLPRVADTATTPAPPRPRWVRLRRFPTPEKRGEATVCVVGTLDAPKVAPVTLVAEGSDVYRPSTIRTAQNRQLEVWSQTPAPTDLERLNQKVVVAAAARVILAQTVTHFLHPTPALPASVFANPDQGSGLEKVGFADDPEDDTDHPVHATVSELIARWSGWSLTVPMPGKTDDPGTSPAPKLPFRIVARRPRNLATFQDDPSTLYPSSKDSWLLNPLRFHRSYQFCLRRSDLAGNHYYDESESHAEVLPGNEQKLAGGVASLTSLVGETTFARAQATFRSKVAQATTATVALRGPLASTNHITPEQASTVSLPAGATRPVLQGEGTAPDAPTAAGQFSRADRCGPPLLAFAYGQATPSYRKTDEAPPAAARGGAPPEAELQLVAYQRALELVLITDVFGGGSFDDDAQAELLPPTSAVETVFLHGRLDDSPYPDVARSIQWHERHLDYNLFGLNKNGWLNYFGDWTARTIRIGLRSGDTLPRTFATPPAVAFFSYLNVLKPLRVQLSLEASERPDTSTPGLSPPLDDGAISLDSPVPDSPSKTLVHLKLPPGTEAEAVLQLPGPRVYDGASPWRSIRLVHALNGAWLRPSWVKLLEAAGSPSGPNTITSRHVHTEFSLDVTSTGAFTVTGYWNDLWDEAVPAQHEPAVAVASVENGSVRVAVIEPSDPGFGFGSQAAVLIPRLSRKPARMPVFEPVLERGRVSRIIVHDSGDGLPSDLKLRVIRRPPLLWPARATARLRGAGTDLKIDAVTVDDAGGWYASPPFVVAHDFGGDGFGARLRAVLDQYGGVAAVEVDDGGQNYSNDVRLAFYTNRFETAETPIEYDPPVDRLPTTQAFEFDHPFNDARARSVDYVVRLSSRFRHYLKDTTQQGPPAPAPIEVPRLGLQPSSDRKVLNHVPRFSQPRQIDVTSRSRPVKPDVAYLMPAFDWSVDALGATDLDAAAGYFRSPTAGRLAVRRNALTRVYLFRPWNGSGPEQLGVVVLPATLNTIRVDHGDPTNPTRVSPDDGGAFNVATSPEAVSGKELGYFNEPLAGSIIPEAMRPLVSRWGFDPAWREAAYPPLSVDQILSRKPGTTYEWLAESPTVAGSASGTPAANLVKPAATPNAPAANPGTPRTDQGATVGRAAGAGASTARAAAVEGDAGNGFDLRLISWGDGTGAPTSGKNLVVVGTDNNGLLHIRIFDASGTIVTDTDETKPPAQGAAIATLKQKLEGFSPNQVLTDDQKKQVISEVRYIVGRVLGNDWRPVWLALHDVQYDAVKERWYVDLRIDLTEVARRHQSNPFVQLALVAYQVNGLPGQRVSPVALCDMYKLRGDRMLEVVRRDRLRFVLTLRGEFEHTLDRRAFPRRQVVARLQLRDPSLPREIAEHVSPAVPPRRRGATPGRAASATRTLAEYELHRSLKGDAYTATVELEPSDLDAAEQAGLAVIAVEEYEIYPAAEAGRGEHEDGLFVVDGRLCARQLVYAFQLEIGPTNAAAPAVAVGS